MKASLRAVAVLLSVASLSALGAGLERYKDWNKSPEFLYLATDAEQKEWKKVATDDQADRFVQLFWAKRDPDLKTPVNEYKIGFDKRVKEADDLFSLPRMRGALTERGKAYIVVGKPKELKRYAGTKPQPVPSTGPSGVVNLPPPNPEGTSIGESIATFSWEAAYLPEWAKMKSLSAEFIVEQSRDYASSRSGDLKRLESNARSALLVNPGLKEAPHYRTAEELEAERQAALAAETEARKGPALTPAVRAALEGVAEDTALLAVVPLAGGESDDTRLQAQVFLPASVGEPPAESRLAFLVRSKDGKDAARFEEVTAFEPAAGGRFASRWFEMPPGDYVVAAGVFDPSGKALAVAKKAVTVTAVPTDFAISPLIVAAAFYAVPNPRPEDAFTFSGHRFVAKGGRLDPQDGVIFVVRVYNPAVDPATKTVSLSRTVRLKPKGAPGMDLPQPQDPPIPVPDRKDKDAKGGILTVDLSALLIETKLGDYLKKPGEYEIKVVVTDNVSKKKAEETATFVVTGTAPAAKK